MKILNVAQGSPEWLAIRKQFRPASEAPAMMGASKHTTRSALLHMHATAGEREFADWVQENLLDKGHELEAAARPLVEAMIGDDLYPATVTDDADYLLASLDGLTMDGETGFEHKSWNEDLAAQVRAKSLDPMYFWQLEHQLAAGGMKRIMFVCSDGTPDRFVSMEYGPVPGRAEQLLSGWKQFDADLAEYQHVEVLPAPVGKALMALPALNVRLVGEVRESNLVVYRDTAIAFIEGIKTDLQTDQDFADAEKAVKFCEDGEKELEAAKAQALSQTQTIDELFKTIDLVKSLMRDKRLMLDKLVKARKESIRVEIRQGGIDKLAAHIAALNARLGKPYMPVIDADFAGVMKGKKTISSLRDAVDTELARAKIEANATADRIDANLKSLREMAKDHAFLFADASALVLKANDDLQAIITSRIATHVAQEAQKEADQREKIRQEELARIERESAEQKRRDEENAATASATQAIDEARKADAIVAPVLDELADAVAALATDMAIARASDSSKPANVVRMAGSIRRGPPTLRLGQIGERLGFNLTAEFLKSIGFDAAARERSAVLYHESDWYHICGALVDHIRSVANSQAA